jgi:hypothetical protein
VTSGNRTPMHIEGIDAPAPGVPRQDAVEPAGGAVPTAARSAGALTAASAAGGGPAPGGCEPSLDHGAAGGERDSAGRRKPLFLTSHFGPGQAAANTAFLIAGGNAIDRKNILGYR